MKRAIVLTLVFLIFLSSCGASDDVEIDFGESEIYSKADIEECMKIVKDEIGAWEGVELLSISYTSDEENNDENISSANQVADAKNLDIEFTQFLLLLSDFRSPEPGVGTWEESERDRLYPNWEWHFARADEGEWQLVNMGF